MRKKAIWIFFKKKKKFCNFSKKKFFNCFECENFLEKTKKKMFQYFQRRIFFHFFKKKLVPRNFLRFSEEAWRDITRRGEWWHGKIWRIVRHGETRIEKAHQSRLVAPCLVLAHQSHHVSPFAMSYFVSSGLSHHITVSFCLAMPHLTLSHHTSTCLAIRHISPCPTMSGLVSPCLTVSGVSPCLALSRLALSYHVSLFPFVTPSRLALSHDISSCLAIRYISPCLVLLCLATHHDRHGEIARDEAGQGKKAELLQTFGKVCAGTSGIASRFGVGGLGGGSVPHNHNNFIIFAFIRMFKKYLENKKIIYIDKNSAFK